MRNAQSSMEYLIVVGIAFLVMIPSTYFLFNLSQESSQEIQFVQLESIGRTIVDTAEALSYSGAGSRTTLRVNMPEGIESSKIIDQRELVFNVSTAAGYSDFVFISRVNITSDQNCGSGVCNLPLVFESGVKNIRIEALNDSVLIVQVE